MGMPDVAAQQQVTNNLSSNHKSLVLADRKTWRVKVAANQLLTGDNCLHQRTLDRT
jgi:hypothetical protein